jgi:hypothetical protein
MIDHARLPVVPISQPRSALAQVEVLGRDAGTPRADVVRRTAR